MNFDKVIMNPPYGKLHLPILKKCVEEFVDIENGGEIVSLQPVRWLQDPLAKYKKNSDALKMQSCLEGRIEDIEIINSEHAFALFKTASFTVDLGIFYIKHTINKSFFNVIPIIDKILLNNNNTIDNFAEHDKRNGYRAIIPRVGPCYYMRPKQQKGKYLTKYTNNGFLKNGNDWTMERGASKNPPVKGSPISYSIKFNTETELENFIESTKTKFFRYLVYEMHRDVHVPNKYLPFMEDYTEPWTDERFYEYFKLTPEEIKTIEDTIK